MEVPTYGDTGVLSHTIRGLQYLLCVSVCLSVTALFEVTKMNPRVSAFVV